MVLLYFIEIILTMRGYINVYKFLDKNQNKNNNEKKKSKNVFSFNYINFNKWFSLLITIQYSIVYFDYYLNIL